MKYITSLIILFFLHLGNTHAGYAGIWGADCKSESMLSFIVVKQAYISGPYQITGAFINYATEPTNIIDDPSIKIISENSFEITSEPLQLKNSILYKCSSIKVPQYDKVDTSNIESLLKGEWEATHAIRMDKRVYIAGGRTGVANLIFKESNNYTSKSKHKTFDGTFKVEGLYLVFDNKNKYKKRILLINDKELHLASDSKPRSGITRYERAQNK